MQQSVPRTDSVLLAACLLGYRNLIIGQVMIQFHKRHVAKVIFFREEWLFPDE